MFCGLANPIFRNMDFKKEDWGFHLRRHSTAAPSRAMIPVNTKGEGWSGAVGTEGSVVAVVGGGVMTSTVAVGVGVKISSGSFVTFSANPTA